MKMPYRLKKLFNKGNTLFPTKGRLFAAVTYFDKDKMRYGSSQMVEEKWLEHREYKFWVDTHGHPQIEITDTLFDREAWSALNPLGGRR